MTYTFRTFHAECFILIHPDLENCDSALEEVFSVLWEQKQAVMTLLPVLTRFVGLFSFCFEWRKCWRASLHQWSLSDHWETWELFARSVVQILSDLTRIASDEEQFGSETQFCLELIARSGTHKWKNYRISRSSPKIHLQEKQSIVSASKEWSWLPTKEAQFYIVAVSLA